MLRNLAPCLALLLLAAFSAVPAVAGTFDTECPKTIYKAIEHAEKDVMELGCVLAFELACHKYAVPLLEEPSGEVACIAGGVIVGKECGEHGKSALKKFNKRISSDTCDAAANSLDQGNHIVVLNHLREHDVNPRVALKDFPDLHSKPEKLPPGRMALFSLNDDKTRHIKVQIDRPGKPDITKGIHHVKPGRDMVAVYYHDGEYHLWKGGWKEWLEKFGK